MNREILVSMASWIGNLKYTSTINEIPEKKHPDVPGKPKTHTKYTTLHKLVLALHLIV